MRYVCVLFLLGVVFISFPARAESVTFRVEVECDNCTSYSNLVIDLRDSSKNNSATAPVTVGGTAEFQGIPEGSYLLTVRTGHGDRITEQLVTVRSQGSPLSIRLPEEKAERPVSGLVSVARLKHKVPKDARKAFNKSVQLSEKGDAEGSLEYLKKATELDAQYMEAFNNLGARYLHLGKNEKALAAFQRALELDPAATMVQINFGAAQIATGDLKGAESTLRRVAGNSGEVKAKYMLGLALYAQQKYTDEAVDLLRRSQDDFPNARLALATIHARLGHTKEARQALKTYMAGAPEAGKQQAQEMLARLQND